MTLKNHWLSKVKPLPAKRIEVIFHRRLTEVQAQIMRVGNWPIDMEDRWVVFLGDASLDMWRSWSGDCIYRLPAKSDGDGVEIGPLFVNADRRIYRSPGKATDVRNVEMLIDQTLALIS